MTRGLLMDFGGTIDTDGMHWFHVFRQAYSMNGNRIPEELLRMAYVNTERLLEKESLVGPSFTMDRTIETKIELQTGFLAQNGVTVPNRNDVHWYCMSLVRRNVSQVSAPVLRKLSDMMPVVLVTNFYGNMDCVLDELGIGTLFKGVVESARVGVRKPDERIMRMGCELLDMEPSHVMMVGDSMKNDVAPAHSIGCRTCLLDCGMPFAPGIETERFAADVAIRSLAGLPAVV